jgi:uroporphyrinogen decarboxylase
LTSKERVRAAIQWNHPDRIPVHENFWTDTLTAWKAQGLPESVEMYPPLDTELENLNSVEAHFDLDVAPMYLDSSPRFEQKIVSHDGDFYTFDDRFGYQAVKTWQKSGTIHYTKTVTEDQDAWNNLVKPRMQMVEGDTARIDDRSYFEHFESYPTWGGAKKKFNRFVDAERYVLAINYGPWEATWRHRDFSRVLMDIALEPEWFEEMAQTHKEVTLSILAKSISEGIKPDGYLIIDDLGSATAPLISPTMFRDILKPIYIEMGKFLKMHGIDFWLHSCGNVGMLLDDYVECGIQVLNPVQVSAGMNVLELADRYEGVLAFYGSIDAHKVSGPWEILEKDLEARCRRFSKGGWIAHSDHSIPPDMSYEQFYRMLKFIKEWKA